MRSRSGETIAEGDSAAEVHQPLDRRSRRRRLARARASRARSFGFGRRRQGMEHRQMRGHLVALGRIMASAQMLEPGEIALRDLGGDDQRAGHWSRCKLLEPREIVRRASSVTHRLRLRHARRARASGASVSPTPADAAFGDDDIARACRCGSRPWRRRNGRARASPPRPARASAARPGTAPRPASSSLASAAARAPSSTSPAGRASAKCRRC